MERRPLVLILVGLLVVAATGGTFLTVRPAQKVFGNSTYAESSTGLRLYVSLNATVFRLGQSVDISVQEYNPLAQSINLSRSNRWPVGGLSLGPCGTLNFPMGFAVYAGYYTSSDIFLGVPLPLFELGTYYCPMFLSNIDYYLFQAESDVGQVFGSCIPNPCLTMPMATYMSIGGFWLTSLYVEFPPGIYTVAVEDEWGTMFLLHFVVTL